MKCSCIKLKIKIDSNKYFEKGKSQNAYNFPGLRASTLKENIILWECRECNLSPAVINVMAEWNFQ
jgi:hypothetical protein